MGLAPKQIEPANWNFLLEAIHQGKCVPFLGAAANIGGSGPAIPTGVGLAKAIVATLAGVNPDQLDSLYTLDLKPELEARKDIARVIINDLARVSLHYRNEVGYKDFLDDIRGRLILDGCGPAPLLKLLARMPLDLIVSTNYDCMMESALGERPFLPVSQPLRGFDEFEGKEVNDRLQNFEGVRVYKFHGEFPPEKAAGFEPGAEDADVSPIIITEEDYIQFLTVLGEPLRGVPEWIKSQFRKRRILFLGYGLEDWDFRTLFEALVAPIPKLQKPTSYALQKDPSDFWVKYWQDRGVKIYDLDLSEFAQQLEDKYTARYGAPPVWAAAAAAPAGP